MAGQAKNGSRVHTHEEEHEGAEEEAKEGQQEGVRAVKIICRKTSTRKHLRQRQRHERAGPFSLCGVVHSTLRRCREGGRGRLVLGLKGKGNLLSLVEDVAR